MLISQLYTILWLILAIPAIFIFVGQGIGGVIEGIDESIDTSVFGKKGVVIKYLNNKQEEKTNN